MAVWREGEGYLMIPHKQLFLLNTPGPEDKEWEDLLSDSLDQSKGYSAHQGSEGTDKGKVSIESFEWTGGEDPQEKFS